MLRSKPLSKLSAGLILLAAGWLLQAAGPAPPPILQFLKKHWLPALTAQGPATPAALERDRLLAALKNLPPQIQILAFSPDNQLLAAGTGDGTVQVWSLAQGKALATWKAHAFPVSHLAFNAGGTQLVSVGSEGEYEKLARELKVWEPATGTLRRQLGVPGQQVRELMLSLAGNKLLLATDKEIKLWDVEAGRPVTGLATDDRAFALRADGHWYAEDDGAVSLWQTEPLAKAGSWHMPDPCAQVLDEHAANSCSKEYYYFAENNRHQVDFYFPVHSPVLRIRDKYSGTLHAIDTAAKEMRGHIQASSPVFDANGQWMLDPSQQRVLGWDLASGQAFLTSREGAWVFAIAPRFEDAAPFSEGLASVWAGGKWSYIDRQGKTALEPEILHPGPFSEGLAAVNMGGSKGYIDTAGQVAIAPRFKEAGTFSGGLAKVTPEGQDRPVFIDKTGQEVPTANALELKTGFSEGLAIIAKDKTYGYVDKTGQFKIAPRFQGVCAFNEGLACVQDTAGKWGYVDTRGVYQIRPQFEGAGSFSQGLAAVRVYVEGDSYRQGYIDKAGNWAIPAQFRNTGDFTEGLAWATSGGDKWGYIDTKGKYAFPPTLSGNTAWGFSQGLAAAQLNGKVGFIDKKGKWAIKAQFDDAYGFTEGLVPVLSGSRWGYVDLKGNMAIQPRFAKAYNFHQGLAPVSDGTRWGYLDTKGRMAIVAQFEDASLFGENYAAAAQNGLWGYIDRQGKWLVPPRFEAAMRFAVGFATVRQGGLWGVIDQTGAYVIEPRFLEIGQLKDGLAWTTGEYGYSFVNKTGVQQFPFLPYDDARLFSEGLAGVKKDKKWGFIDKTGRLVIPARFEEVGDFHEKRAAVKQDDAWGYIDPIGALVIPPKYSEASSFANGLALISQGEGKFFIDPQGQTVMPAPPAQEISGFSDGLALVKVGQRYGYIDAQSYRQ